MSRDGYQWADTNAAKMLLSALERAKEQRGLSVRQAAQMLGYKQAVVLSHMANGRAPIPIDRASDIASLLEMNPEAFLMAVLEQRHPDVNWKMISTNSGGERADSLGAQLELILDAPLSALNADQRRVLREVAAERKPSRRWLTVHELPILEKIRQTKAPTHNIDADEVDEILAMIEDHERDQ